MSRQKEAIFPESYIQRSVFISGLLLKNFNFSLSADSNFFEPEMIKEIFNILLLLMKESNSALQWYTLKTLNAVCWQDSSYFYNDELKSLYHRVIFSRSTEVNLKYQVLNNLLEFLSYENETLCGYREESKSVSTESFSIDGKLENQEDKVLEKRIIVIQKYLNLVLFCSILQEEKLRHLSVSIVQILIQDGLIPPQKIIPHLIALTTDQYHAVSIITLQMLTDLNLSHPGILHSCIKTGLKLSFDLQVQLQTSIFVRGVEDESSNACLRHIYSIVQHHKRGRRSFIRTLLRELEETIGDINKLLYLSDTLAYLPYEFQDELLYIIHVICILASTTGSMFVEEFEQLLLPKQISNMHSEENESEEHTSKDDEDIDVSEEDCEDNLLDRIPDDTNKLEESVISFQNCLFLLRVKKFLQETYNINNRKVFMYSPEHEDVEENIQIHLSSLNKYISTADMEIIASIKQNNHLGSVRLIRQYIELKRLVFLENYDLDKDVLKRMPQDSQVVIRKRNAVEADHHPKAKKRNRKAKTNKRYARFQNDSDSDYRP